MTDWDEDERQALDSLQRELADLRERHRDDPSLGRLRAARAGALPDTMQDAIVGHLESNLWSRALVEGADSADASLDTAAESRLLSRIHRDVGATPLRPKKQRVWAPVLALGAMAAVLLAALLLWRPSGPPTEKSAPAAQTTPQPAVSVFALQLTKPDVKLTPAALRVRGQGGSRLIDDLAPGLNAYRADDYATAARELEAVQPKYRTSVELLFYLGVSRLFLNDAAAAVPVLESARALNEASFADDVEWYLAVAYERAGSIAQSRALLDDVCNRKGTHSADACAAMSGRR